MFNGRGLSGSDDDPLNAADPQSRFERAAAFLTWSETANHFQDNPDEGLTRLTFWEQYVEWLIVAGAIVFFVGGYAAFIVMLAVTR
jgi:hypothetical protein